MTLIEEIHSKIESKNMLFHPFYRDWMEGKLSIQQLQNYAEQYTPFVDAFPRFVSATHSQCDDPIGRKLLLENLMDEEGKSHSEPHPKLWRDFARGVGGDADRKLQVAEKAEALEAVFFDLCRSSYEEGLCALYAYEYQIPAIAKAKIEGLAQHYDIKDQATTEFFAVHQTADVYHSKACAQLINSLPEEKREQAVRAAEKASEALWNFLTEAHGELAS